MKRKHVEKIRNFVVREKISITVVILAGALSWASLYGYHHIKLAKIEEKWNHILLGEGPKEVPTVVATSSLALATSTPDALVLVYHKVYTPEQYTHVRLKNFTTTTTVFESELSYLKDHDYTPLTMKELLDGEKAGNLPAKPVVITFDDGWKDQYLNALPLLQKYHMKATFYIYTGVIGSSAFMDWDELHTLLGANMEIGDHTTHHPNLKKVPVDTLPSEILASKQDIEQHLGIHVTDFAYPYGLYNETVIDSVRSAGFLSARTSDKGITKDFSNPYIIKTYYAPRTLDDFIVLLKKANTFDQ